MMSFFSENLTGRLNRLILLIGDNQLAELLNIKLKTLYEWTREVEPADDSGLSEQLNRIYNDIINPQRKQNASFTFIDLFAGIGGLRMGFEAAGGQCIFTSEWNRFSQKTYRANFPDQHSIVGDITRIDAAMIPRHDVLLAGFPCQPFSLAGVSKKNALGRAHGFECATQGTLFFDVERIIAARRPKAFLLENVKNLKSHDGGKTFEIIMYTLQKKLGYQVHAHIINADGLVPQHRERIFLVGFRDPMPFSWDSLCLPAKGSMKIKDILHPENGQEATEKPYTSGLQARVNEAFFLSEKLWNYLQAYKQKHQDKGNGFGYGLISADGVARTLSARYYKDGSEILLSRGEGKTPRKLTPRECARLMGYPDTFKIPVSNTQSYRQFGNSVVVPVVKEIARIMAPFIVEPACQTV